MRGFGAILALGLLGLLARPAAAQQLDPQVAMPLMQLIQAAGAQCQMGNQQACGIASQLQQGANELAQVQLACQQGNPQACQMFQNAAQQVAALWQQTFGGGGAPQQGYTPGYSPQQQAWDHQQRMQQQQMQFQQQQWQYQQQQRMNDMQHQRFMDTLRR